MKVYKIIQEHPEPEIIQRAVTLISGGGIIAFPTRCLYGLGADAFNAEAVARVFEIKKRPSSKADIDTDRPARTPATTGIACVKSCARIMDGFWPGRVTLVFDADDTVPHQLTAGTGKIGIRLPGHPVAAALVEFPGGAAYRHQRQFIGRTRLPPHG